MTTTTLPAEPWLREYRSTVVCDLIGITARQLNYWDASGVVQPSLCQASGQGSQRLYSRDDLVCLKVVKTMLDAGLELRQAAHAEALRDVGTVPASASLVVGERDVVLARSKKQVIDLLQDRQVATVVTLAGIISDLDAATAGTARKAS